MLGDGTFGKVTNININNGSINPAKLSLPND